MKTERKTRIAPRLFAALVVLTLLSCCFLGVTYARYSSSSTGSAGVSIAEWNIAFNKNVDEGSTILTFSNLSPDDREGSADYVRSHSTEPTLVATITNNSAVSATVSVAASLAPTFTYEIGGFTDSYSEYKYNGGADLGNTFAEADIARLFSIKFYSDDEGTTEFTDTTLLPGAKVDIYAVVTWTTNDDYGATDNFTAGDAIDTFVGMYVDNANWTLTYTAVQASEAPVTTAVN